MKAYKIKTVMTQEYISFGETREDAIANHEYSQGYDFDQVEINGDFYANGNVIDSKTTAVSMGKDNWITFNAKDQKFAYAMWISNHDDQIMIKDYEGETRPISSEVITSEDVREEVAKINRNYKYGYRR
tara:strand:- start:179 stop:565 length:387 start_codon:yes stop_codon:yes gene_type:complete